MTTWWLVLVWYSKVGDGLMDVECLLVLCGRCDVVVIGVWLVG